MAIAYTSIYHSSIKISLLIDIIYMYNIPTFFGAVIISGAGGPLKDACRQAGGWAGGPAGAFPWPLLPPHSSIIFTAQ